MDLPQLSLPEIAWATAIPLIAATVLWLPLLAGRKATLAAELPGDPSLLPQPLPALLPSLTAPLAVATAFILGYWALETPDSFPPVKSLNWLYPLTFLMALLAIGEAFLRGRSLYWKLPVWLAAIAIPLWAVTRSMRLREGGPPEGVYLTLCVTLAIALAWRTATEFTLRRTPLTTLFNLGLLTAAAAALVGLTGSHVGPFRTGTLALALLPPALFLLALRLRRRALPTLPTTLLTVWSGLLPALLLGHYLYAETTRVQLLLFAPAPLLPALVPARRRGWPWTLLRVVLALAPIAIALTLAALKFRRDAAEAAEYGY